jgi:hypothetical protein
VPAVVPEEAAEAPEAVPDAEVAVGAVSKPVWQPAQNTVKNTTHGATACWKNRRIMMESFPESIDPGIAAQYLVSLPGLISGAFPSTPETVTSPVLASERLRFESLRSPSGLLSSLLE